MTDKPCKFYESYEKVDPDFEGDKECSWYAPGIFEGVRLACTRERSKHYKLPCPWGGRPDLDAIQ